MVCNLPSSTIHGIFQARILEWVAISFSRGSSQPRDWTHISYVSCIGRWVLLPLAPPGKSSSCYSSKQLVSVFSSLSCGEQFELDACTLSCFGPVRLFGSPWTVACQVPLSMGFSRQEYWSDLPCLLQRIFLIQGSNLHLLQLLHYRLILYLWSTGEALGTSTQ